MTKKQTLNALMIVLLFNSIISQAQSGLFSSLSNYFTQPSKNAVIAASTIASLCLVSAVIKLWRNHIQCHQIQIAALEQRLSLLEKRKPQLTIKYQTYQKPQKKWGNFPQKRRVRHPLPDEMTPESQKKIIEFTPDSAHIN